MGQPTSIHLDDIIPLARGSLGWRCLNLLQRPGINISRNANLEDLIDALPLEGKYDPLMYSTCLHAHNHLQKPGASLHVKDSESRRKPLAKSFRKERRSSAQALVL